jgi:hypothetical protein
MEEIMLRFRPQETPKVEIDEIVKVSGVSGDLEIDEKPEKLAKNSKMKLKNRVIICGSRTITELKHIAQAWAECEWDIDEIVSGGCNGPDKHGELLARFLNIPLTVFHAEWLKYGKAAGPLRNKEMAAYATHCIAVWDGKSKGTKNMLEEARKMNLEIFESVIVGSCSPVAPNA